MQILESDLFTNELNIILSFIVRKESIKVKNTFKNDLYKALKKLDFMPYKFRKSLAFDDENVRDFIFKGLCNTLQNRQRKRFNYYLRYL